MRKVTPYESNVVTTLHSEDEAEDHQLIKERHKTITMDDFLSLKTKLSFGVASSYKYLHVWKRALFRIKVRKVLSWVGDEIVTFGTSSEFLDVNDNFKLNVDEILWKKQHKKEKFRLLSNYPDESLPFCLLHPECSFVKLWSVVLASLLLYTAAVMPIRVAFYDVIFFDVWTVVDLTMDSLFALDILVNCVVTYEKRDGTCEKNPKVVFCSYARSWMVFDVVACLPFSFIEFGSNTDEYSSSRVDHYNGLIRLMRVPRLYKLLRILRIAKAFKNYKNNSIFAKLQDFFQMNSSRL
jgi:hypothetical protein